MNEKGAGKWDVVMDLRPGENPFRVYRKLREDEPLLSGIEYAEGAYPNKTAAEAAAYKLNRVRKIVNYEYPADRVARSEIWDFMSGQAPDDSIRQAVKAEEERILKEMMHPISYNDQLNIALGMLKNLSDLRLGADEINSVLYACLQIINKAMDKRYEEARKSPLSIEDRLKAAEELFRGYQEVSEKEKGHAESCGR